MEKNEVQEVNSNPQNLMQMAIQQGSSIEHLEKLMNLQERWEKNQARKAFYDAKAKFQQNKPIIKKSEKVSFGNTKYNFAPLSEIQKAIDPILADLGLSYHYKQEDLQGKIKITCVLSHELGHSEETSLDAPADTSGNKNAIQSIGSTVSYLKRYTLSNATGLSTEDDNDGTTTLSVQEAQILKQKIELIDLYFEKKDKLKDDQIKRLEEIIKKNETASYLKSIKHLKTY